MHRVGVTALALSLVTGLGGVAAASAADGDHVYPSKQQVQHARHQAARAADDVAGIKAALVQADLRLQAASVRAEQAAERYNGARWELQQARRDARVAERHAAIAAQDVTQQRHAYAATVVSSYEMGPSLSPLSAVTSSDGLPGVISKMATLQNAQDAMDHTYDSFRASSTLAGVASTQAEAARTHAETLATQARAARDRAAAAAAAADSASQAIAAQKTQLIHRLANLQHVSVSLAQKRQTGIEKAAQAAAQRAAEAAARRRERQQAAEQAQQQADQTPSSGPTADPTDPPTSDPTPEPSGPTSPPPPPRPPRLRRRALRPPSRSRASRSVTPTSGVRRVRTPGTAPG